MGLLIYQQFMPLVQGALRPHTLQPHPVLYRMWPSFEVFPSHNVVFGDSHALLGIDIREITVLVVTRDLQISQDKRFHSVFFLAHGMKTYAGFGAI